MFFIIIYWLINIIFIMSSLLYIYNTMLMKKLIALLSVLALTLLASCGKTEVETVVDENTPTDVEINMVEPLEVNTEDVVPTDVEVTTDVTTEDTTMDVSADVEVTASGAEVEIVK